MWNVKRLRPAALGPFDYENENYTPSLWVSEGITSYYGDLLVRRAGLSSDAEYFRPLERHPHAGDDAGPARHAGDAVVVRRLDQAVPPRRELGQHVDQLLHEGAGDRGADRRAHPLCHQRTEVAGRRHAPRVPALLGRQGLHGGAVSSRDQRGRRGRPRRRARARPRHDAAARLSAAARRVRPAVPAGRQPGHARLARHPDEGRRRPAGRQRGAARHARPPPPA